ncbi:hypothetical protein AVEN_116840-1 [Araneus ventricosus]|uniref:Uncharacterized protein n=1 Tax=Araneus ventricosus TaxID=182803 RepID=A0A4Y2G873_ARAVE|nr:hypothetical protein AVEN_116840-1 [Araneus ventricosus]
MDEQSSSSVLSSQHKEEKTLKIGEDAEHKTGPLTRTALLPAAFFSHFLFHRGLIFYFHHKDPSFGIKRPGRSFMCVNANRLSLIEQRERVTVGFCVAPGFGNRPLE